MPSWLETLSNSVNRSNRHICRNSMIDDRKHTKVYIFPSLLFQHMCRIFSFFLSFSGISSSRSSCLPLASFRTKALAASIPARHCNGRGMGLLPDSTGTRGHVSLGSGSPFPPNAGLFVDSRTSFGGSLAAGGGSVTTRTHSGTSVLIISALSIIYT